MPVVLLASFFWFNVAGNITLYRAMSLFGTAARPLPDASDLLPRMTNAAVSLLMVGAACQMQRLPVSSLTRRCT
jgi:hypothetical protein